MIHSWRPNHVHCCFFIKPFSETHFCFIHSNLHFSFNPTERCYCPLFCRLSGATWWYLHISFWDRLWFSRSSFQAFGNYINTPPHPTPPPWSSESVTLSFSKCIDETFIFMCLQARKLERANYSKVMWMSTPSEINIYKIIHVKENFAREPLKS